MEVPTEVLSRYMERRKRDLAECLMSLEGQNFIQLEKVGHQLKGNGVTFGHPELAIIGKKLEKAAAKKDKPLIANALQEFSIWVKHQVN